jgi:peptide/nickel transport system substrate-binding protein
VLQSEIVKTQSRTHHWQNWGVTILVGETVNGRYRIDELLGRGGMGRVWKARDLALDRDVAVKEVPPAYGDEGALDRLVSEARLGARLDHPGIVKVHDIFRHGGNPVIVMAYVNGYSLRSALNDEKVISGYGLAIVALNVLTALGHAHARRVVHRDLKPDNILIAEAGFMVGSSEDGPDVHSADGTWHVHLSDSYWRDVRDELEQLRDRAMITDFGIARLSSLAPPGAASNRSVVVGTTAYMAPEQIRGQAPTSAFDRWALGATLYELAEHRRPFVGRDEFELLEQIQYAPAPQAPHAGAMAGLIRDLLEKDPDMRPTAHEARARVQALLADQD